MKKIYVLIDMGCHECGVSSEYVDSFKDEASAEAAREALSAKTTNWRDGGQSVPEVFEVELP